MSGRSWRVLIVTVIVLIIGGMIGLSLTGKPVIWQPGVAEERPGRQPLLGITLHGQMQAANRHDLKAPADAIVTALIASEGQAVGAGQTLLQLDAPALRRQISAARAELARLQALEQKAGDPAVRQRLRVLETQVSDARGRALQLRQELEGFRAQHPEVEMIGQNYERALAEAARADQEAEAARLDLQKHATPGEQPQRVERYNRAVERQKQAREQFETAREARTRLRDDIARLRRMRQAVKAMERSSTVLQGRLQRLRREPEIAMLTRGRQQVDQAQAKLTGLERRQEALAVKAPVAGTLAELRARPGEQVRAGQTLAILRDAIGAKMVFEVGATDAQRLQVGQRATITPAGAKPFAATVSSITPGKPTARVVLSPMEPDTPLPPTGTALAAQL